jgi:hypothetical protein
MMQKIDIDALKEALAKATPGKWVRRHSAIASVSAIDAIAENSNSKYLGEFYGPDWVDNAIFIALARNALPGLLTELEALRTRTTPEHIGDKHRDGNWWLVWEPFCERWVQAAWRKRSEMWVRLDDGYVVAPTHALLMPPAPEGE